MSKTYVSSGRTNQKLETRNKILQSAQHFLNHGTEPTLEDIAADSGISRATIYRYFSSIDVLAAEAAIDVSTQSPEDVHANLKAANIKDQALEIQSYFNTLTIDHENLFRKYLSTVLDSTTFTAARGARRKKSLQLALADTDYSDQEKEKLSNLLTLFMGIEPMIVTKDVCGLNNVESVDLLKWGIDLIFKGLEHTQSEG